MSADRNHQNQSRTQKFSGPPTFASKTNSPTPKAFSMRYPWLTIGSGLADATSTKTTFDGGPGLLCGTTWGEQLDREYAAAKQRERELDERHKSLERMVRS